jgi:hypothetical protein
MRYGALGIAFALAVAACGSGDSTDSLNNGQGGGAGQDPNAPGSVDPTPGGSTPGTGGGSGGTGGGTTPAPQPTPVLDTRVVDYGEALRIASLKLTGDLPTLDQINAIGGAADQATAKATYEKDIDAMLADARFAPMMIQWWRDTLKTGGPPPAKGMPTFETAATFAAEVVVNDRPYTDLFTAATNTCPTFTPGTAGAAGTFADAACPGTQPTAGLLTDPGLMAQYYANMSFRRMRFVQETFVCSKMPAEFSTTPKAMGAGSYTSPWDFNSITGGTAAKINFQDTSAVICANCHTTLNHQAPLFAHFDMNGLYNATNFEVLVPVPGNPTATLADWLPAGQGFAWRNGTTVADIPAFGAAMSKDPVVATCAVNRLWNWAMSRGDVVNDLATVPTTVTDSFVQDFTKNGYKVKATIAAIYKSDDFVKF